MYADRYPEKFCKNTATINNNSNNNRNMHSSQMLALVTASPFPVPISLIKRLSIEHSNDNINDNNNNDSEIPPTSLLTGCSVSEEHVKKMFTTVVSEHGYYYQVSHQNFEDWKWWEKIAEDHIEVENARRILTNISKNWQSLVGAEKSYAAKYWIRYLIEEEETTEAKKLLLNPEFLMVRSVDPEGLIEECEEEIFEEEEAVVLVGEAVVLGSREDSRGRDGNLYQDSRRMPSILVGHLLGWSKTNEEIKCLLDQLRTKDHGFSWWCPVSPTMEQAGTSRTHDYYSSSYTVPGHNNVIRSAIFSNDGKYVASCSADRTVRVWDTSTGITTHVLKGHDDEVYTLAFSSDGRTLVSGGGNDDPSVRVWKLDEIEAEKEEPNVAEKDLVGRKAEVKVYLKGVDKEEKEKEINIQNKFSMISLKGHSKFIRDLTFSPDNSLVVSASGDNTVRVWDLNSQTMKYELTGHTNEVYATSFSSDGLYILSCSMDETIRIWSINNFDNECKLIHTIDVANQELISVRFAPSCGKNRIVTEAWDKTIRLLEFSAKENTYFCVYTALTNNGGDDDDDDDDDMLHAKFKNDIKYSKCDHELNLKILVKEGTPVGINVGVHARAHFDGHFAVAQDFERLHFLKLIQTKLNDKSKKK
jgi:hypothetical protein